MSYRKVIILCFSLFAATSGSHFEGGIMTFRPRGKNPDGTFTVDIRFKSGFDSSYASELSWSCSRGNCGSITERSYGFVDDSRYVTRWSQTESYNVRRVSSDKPFHLSADSCCWIYNTLNHNGWSLQTVVDLGTRSDTSKPNNSPVTTILPIIRVPQNCPSSINILAHDPDGDIVQCRYGKRNTGECDLCHHPYFNIDEENCILSLSSATPRGLYVVEMVLEDFAPQNINLRYSDGSVAYRYRPYIRKKRAVSKSPRWWWGPSTYNVESQNTELLSDVTGSPELYTAITEITELYTERIGTTYATMEPTIVETETTKTASTAVETEILELTTVEPETSQVTTSIRRTTYVPQTDSGIIDPTVTSLSKIPLQFMVEVTSSVPSCTYGAYRPLFLPPTPNNGEILNARARTPFQIHLAAQATQSRIADFKVSGPYNMTKYTVKINGNSATKIIEWTPTDNDVGDHVPFCFVAETTNGYNSELRCIIVIVGPYRLVTTSLMCNENTMTLFIKKSSVNGLYENHLRLNDPRCLLTSNSTHHIASVGFNSCGTQIEETEDSIVFKNQVTSFDNVTAVITRKHQVIIPFNCSFPKENRLSVSFRPQKAIFEFTEAGFGNFSYKFQFYTSDQFTTVQTQSPLEVWLRDMLYMEIQVMSSVNNIQLFVESCKATPHDNPNDPVFYNIIENGCLQDETLVVYPGTRTRSRFGLETFTFIGNYKEVYVSCTVMLCKVGDPNTRCAQGCVTKSLAETDTSRRKRSLTAEATESLQHFISQGPLRLKRQSLNEDSEGKVALNINTLIMSLSGVAVVALVVTTTYLIKKKTRTTNYQRLSTEEL
ncbi:uncharacterized protein LOC134579227 [Pelobates fuscus]|uniref:uncharacterized protein LOC134579227 n=1 Tax=Pelobates fuscus TaxID=191477 RepID=UPI002FE4B34E